MPQLTQLPDVFWSQLFWLAVVFGIIFFGIGLGMLPKIESTVAARDGKVADDLAGAEAARAAANETEAAYQHKVEESRLEAIALTQASKQESTREAELRIKAADAEIAERSGAAEERIRKASAAAMTEIETIAAEAAQELVAKLAGLKVGRDSAATAVKAALHG